MFGSLYVVSVLSSVSCCVVLQFARILQKLDMQVSFKDFKVQNMVGSCDVRFPIRLEGLATTHSMFCSYEPELFPGLIYRMIDPKVVLLIFVSGKVVLTGAKKRADIYKAFENVYPVLKEFKKATSLVGGPPAAPAALPAPAVTEAAAGRLGAPTAQL